MTERPAKAPTPAGFYALDSNEYGRGVSFFDAIYGFSATLLIANLDAPPPEAWRSLDTLLDSGIGSQLLGFVLSFIVIAVFWRANVRLMANLSGLDGATMTINLIAVALIILLPFTTQGISDDGSNDYALPTVMYALNIALISLTMILLAAVARRHGLERVSVTGRRRTWDLAGAWLVPIVFLGSIPLALTAGPGVAQWSWLSLAFLLPAVGHLAERAGD